VDEARPATPGDLGALNHLRSEALEALAAGKGGDLWRRRDLRHPVDRPINEDLLGDPSHLVLVGTIDGVAVAYALAHLEHLDAGRHPETGEPLAVIDELYVEPDARSVGVGESLVESLLEWATSHRCVGIDAFALPGDRHVKNLFERSGLVARAILVHRRLREEVAGTGDEAGRTGEAGSAGGEASR
jgi:GNAT superfamily N-acetyltransferase